MQKHKTDSGMAYAGHKQRGDWNPSKPYILLKRRVNPDDFSWDYSDLTEGQLNSFAVTKVNKQSSSILMKCVRITDSDIIFSWENIPPTRMTTENPTKFLCVSFNKLTFNNFGKDASKLKMTYIRNVVAQGIRLGETHYEFCGHSNSQLRSRCCYFRVSDTTPIFGGCFGNKTIPMEETLNDCGDFRELTIVSKRAKRLGLLFTSFSSSIHLDSEETKVIHDIERIGHNFTDGCGYIDLEYAKEIFKIVDPDKRKKSSLSVLQIRYKGYKGILAAIPSSEINRLLHQQKSFFFRSLLFCKSFLPKSNDSETVPPKVLLRNSMEKFSCFDSLRNCKRKNRNRIPCDDTLCIVDYSKAYTHGTLNRELVTLLSTLGIPNSVFEKRQKWYLDLIKSLTMNDVNAEIEFCILKGRFHLVKQLKEIKQKGGVFPKDLSCTLAKLQNIEKERFYKEGKLKLRILVPKSRFLFGICDPTGKLQPGECFVSYTDTLILEKDWGHEKVEKLHNKKVIVSRNPCLHPGDIQQFTSVNIPELDSLKLVDCIVFSVHGEIPAASMMSGGDLDGDKFFVSWDPELIPSKMHPPEDYSKYTPKEHTATSNIPQKDMAAYFSDYNTSTLGYITSLHSRWVKASLERAACVQCIELNRLHSQCVDGGKVRIPKALTKCPPPIMYPEFIVDILERAIRNTFPCDKPIVEENYIDLEECDELETPEVPETSHISYFSSLLKTVSGLWTACIPGSNQKISNNFKYSKVP